jgi:hypothetical protein|tara:strand:+ start:100 stop:300 length:201 start_codon:yes stop_codon:yes gene_type:complete
MTVEQWEAWLTELHQECNPRTMGHTNPVTFFLLTDAAIAWLAQQLFNRQERAIEVRLMEAEAYGPH